MTKRKAQMNKQNIAYKQYIFWYLNGFFRL